MIHTITEWHDTQTGNRVYLCGDLHMDFPSMTTTRQQQDALIEAAKALNALVIFEGALDYDGQDTAIMNHITWYKANYQRIVIGQLALLDCAPEETFDADMVQSWAQAIESTPLHALGARLSQAGIQHDNVEFRHLYVASLGGHPVSYQRILDYTQEIIARIRSFDDGQAYASFYEERIARFITNNTDLYQQGTLNQKCNLAKPLNQFHVGWIIRCALYGQELLDALYVHSLVQHATTHKNIIVVSGSDHIRVINEFMPQIGYQRIQAHGGPYWRSEDNTRQAVSPLNITAVLTPWITPTIATHNTWYQRLTSLWR